MAKMHFKYATMNSGKSIDLIRTAYNYEENGFKVVIMKPIIDTKAGNKISSRVGMERTVDFLIEPNSSILELLKNSTCVNAIFIDESQFLSSKQVDELFIFSKVFDIPVICYGLRLNFKGESFEGSKRLLEVCEELEEIPTLCKCGEIARYVGRKENDEFVTDGLEVVIDGCKNVEYVPLCGDCFLEKVKKIDYKDIRRNVSSL